MRFASLGSGSGGNATLIDDGESLLLVDCGFGLRDTEQRMQRLGVHPEQLCAILVTHEHGDHIKGLGPLARKYQLPVYMTPGTHASRDYGSLPRLELIHGYQPFRLGAWEIRPVAVPHDAREPAQYVFERGGLKLGVLTDLGRLTPHVIDAYAGCHFLLIEANHDLDMLAEGPYPPSLKDRVAGAWGHLNNGQVRDYLQQNLDGLQVLVLGHISRKNNSLALVKSAMADILAQVDKVHFACQDEGFDWIPLELPQN